MRFCAILVIASLLFASVPLAAEGPGPAKPLIPFDKLAASSSSQPDPAAIQAAMNNPANPPAQTARKRHLSHAGKIMTYIGIPVMAGGAAMLAYGLSNGDSTSCNGLKLRLRQLEVHGRRMACHRRFLNSIRTHPAHRPMMPGRSE